MRSPRAAGPATLSDFDSSARKPVAKTEPSLNLRSPFFWPTRLGLGLLKLTGRLPYALQWRLGITLGELMYRFARGRREIAATNLKLCFPELSASEHRRLLRENMHATGLGIVEIGTSWWTPDEKLRPMTELRGREHLDAALAAGRGAIMLSFHFTSLELCAHLLARQIPVAAMYRPHPNPLFDAQMLAGRQADARMVLARDDIRGTLKALKANLPLWYAADQDYGRQHSLFVPFFGTPAATITATSRFAKMTGAPVIPFTHRRLPGGRGFVLELHPPLADIPSGDDYADALSVNRFLEAYLRQYPADYMWLHRRFKTRPEGGAPVYGRSQERSRQTLSPKRYARLLARATVLRERPGKSLSLVTPEAERVRVFYRRSGWRSLFGKRDQKIQEQVSQLAGLGLPQLPVEAIRFCRAYHCDVVFSPVHPGTPLPEAITPDTAHAAAELLLRLHAAGVTAPMSALMIDAQGQALIAEPEACRIGTPLDNAAREAALMELPEPARALIRPHYQAGSASAAA